MGQGQRQDAAGGQWFLARDSRTANWEWRMISLVSAATIAAAVVVAAALPVLAQSDSSAPLQTPGAYGHSNVEHAAVAPLHDLNLTRQKIPPVLLAAMADPYARAPRSCRAIFVRVGDLSDALGPDFDESGTPVDPSVRGKATPTALALMHRRGGERPAVPCSFISTLSGAEKCTTPWSFWLSKRGARGGLT